MLKRLVSKLYKIKVESKFFKKLESKNNSNYYLKKKNSNRKKFESIFKKIRIDI